MKALVLAVVAFLVASIVPVARATDVTITRDAWGGPRIVVPPTVGRKAKRLRALGFTQGYVTAQDRMVQLGFLRRAGKGRLSEIAFLGPSYLPGDIEARRDGFTDEEVRTQVRRRPGETARIPSAGLLPEPAHLRDRLALYEGFGFHSNPNTLADLEGPTMPHTVTLP